MVTKTLIIKKIYRSPAAGSFDALDFEPGVNVIVGPPNTGKTQWLRMLNYLMGDTDSPSKAFDNDLVEKYDSVSAIFVIDGEEILVERFWKQQGNQGKVFIDHEPIKASEFSNYILSRLGIPILHFPQGDPYSSRTWPELSWRTLFRHIYRQQSSWNDLAYKQPESDQRACLMLFLGIAEFLFSEKYEQLVQKRKEIYKKLGSKDEFVKTLNQISTQLLDREEITVAVTPDSIASAITNLNNQTNSLEAQRIQILNKVRDDALAEYSQGSQNTSDNKFQKLEEQYSKLNVDKSNILNESERTENRLRELRDYRSKIKDELSRIARAKNAGQIFSNFRVTHCPACGQSVHSHTTNSCCCYLCGQTVDVEMSDSSTASEQRLDFEETQLQEEYEEAEELIEVVAAELEKLKLQQRNLEEELLRIKNQIRPLQALASVMIIPPDIALIDMELGRLQEKRQQLERVRGALELQSNYATELDNLERDVKELEIEVATLEKEINFEQVSADLAQHMNTYLNKINEKNSGSWSQDSIDFRLKERSFNFTVGGNKWNSLGATMTLYFLTAYNYALLSLSNKEKYHYPGLAILDLPPTFQGITVAEKENFILEPFIDLINMPSMKNTQVIATGNSFLGLEGVNQIVFDRVWK